MTEQIKHISDLVSIAIPAYKAEFLKEAIGSVLNQTYSNFELIIVNDKSPEDIDSIVHSFNDSRIRYYKNEKNLGKESIVLNWNKCLSYAKGEFFVLLCDDDIMDTQFLSSMLALAKEYPRCNVFKTRTTIYNQIKNIIIGKSTLWPKYESYNNLLHNTIIGNRKHTISEFLYRTEHIKRHNGFTLYPAGYYADDHSILKFTQEGGIVTTEESFITYRKNENNISNNTKYNKEKVKAALKYYDWLYRHSQEEYKSTIINRLDYDIYNYAIVVENLIKLFCILTIIPNNVWDIKKKIIIIKKYILQKIC